MANAFRTIEDAGKWVAAKSLYLLESKRSVSQFFNTDYSREFKLSYPVGKSIEVPYPMQWSIRNGLEANPQAISRRHATISIGEPFGIDWEMDSLEKVLLGPRERQQYTKDFIDPAMAQLAQEIDSRCALYAMQHGSGVVGALGTNPSTFDATSGAARQNMADLGANAGDERGMIVPPAVMRAVKTSAFGSFNPVKEIERQFRTGLIGHSDSFDWYETSASLYKHTAGTWAGAVTVTTAPSNGASTLSVTCTTGDTFKAGDKFSIASVLPVHPITKRSFGSTAATFSVTAAATGASSAATLSIEPPIYYEGPYQNVDSQPAASAALTLWPGTTSPNGKVGMVGLAIPQNAFALVGVEMPLFTDQEVCQQRRNPETGIAIRYSTGSDIRSSKHLSRFDVCIGLGTFYGQLCQCVACG